MSESIYDKCLTAYEAGGQQAVFNLVLSEHPDTKWEYCEPCEIESPVADGTCLVCGSCVLCGGKAKR